MSVLALFGALLSRFTVLMILSATHSHAAICRLSSRRMSSMFLSKIRLQSVAGRLLYVS
jgi:hypothetical protein